MDIAKSISEGLARNVLSATVNGEVWDANRPINQDSSVKLNTWNDQEGKDTFWHSSAHLLASAINELYPNAKFGIGPAIENGFYYDIDFGENQISPEDFTAIEQKMIELVKSETKIIRKDISKSDALKMFSAKKETIRLNLLKSFKMGL